MRTRPLGHDAVVVALLLLSCSDVHEKELGHDVPVTIEAPVKAHVERRMIESTRTAGCGCSGGNGGRGAIPGPSCANSHCSSQTTIVHRCKLVVERDKPAKQSFDCDGGAVSIEVDTKGERFAMGSGSVWNVSAGGYAGSLSSAMNGYALLVVDKVDWATLPSAREIIRKDLDTSLRRVFYDDVTPREAMAARFTNLERVAPEHLAEDIVTLAAADVRMKPCPWNGRTSWLDFYEKQTPAVQSAVKAQLVAGLDVADVNANVHALRAMSPRELVQHVGDPAQWLAGDAGTELVRAAIVDAWSTTSPSPAATWACKALASALPPLVEDAALLAVGRAGLKCAAVLGVRSRHCPQAKQYVADVDAARTRLTADDKVPGDALFCAPALGYVLAQVAVTPELDEDTWRERCFPRDAATSTSDR